MLILILNSCKDQEKNKMLVELALTEDVIRLSLDERAKTNVSTFFVHDKYYLLHNEATNEILYYDRKTKEIVKKTQFEEQGPNGVGKFIGFYPLNADQFILTRPDLCELAIVNSEGVVIKRMRYDKNEDGDLLIPGVSTTAVFGPMAIIRSKIFLTQMINPYFGEELFEKSSVSISIDTTTNQTESLPLKFPPIISIDKILNHQVYANEFNVYRTFNGQQFIYSFSFEEDIYVTSISHDTIQKVKAKSKYIDKLQPIKPGITDSQIALKRMAEVAMYRNILYDPYKNIYYRFVYIENELNKNENFSEQLRYGHSLFSILILDENFNVIGETLFPEFIYNPTLAFVDEDGFYISESHYRNPDYNDDVLSFRKFKLIKNK